MKHFRLNADLGEGSQHDALLMPHLTYCNIACGGHTGDTPSMLAAIQLAKKYNVEIGAHPSYPDPENFGRAIMDIPYSDLSKALVHQLQTFKKVADSLETKVHHVKAHGALYHKIVDDAAIRKIYLKTVEHVFDNVKIILPAHADTSAFDIAPTRLLLEAFGDRQYDNKLRLLSRAAPAAVLNTSENIASQIHKLHHNGKVLSKTGEWMDIRFDTICLHGDHAGVETYFPEVISLLQKKNEA